MKQEIIDVLNDILNEKYNYPDDDLINISLSIPLFNS